jgi:nitroreductase
MDAFDAILKRVSCRSYLDKPVPKELLEKVVDAGRRAPTARNEQPVEFVVVSKKDKLADIAGLTDYGRFIANAPACIVVFSKDTKYYLEDGAAAVENILIAVAALDLGACWVAGDKKAYAEAMREKLNVPENYKLIALLPLGYPAKAREPHEKRPLDDVLHWEQF